MTEYSIVRIGSAKTEWAIECDGVIFSSHPSAEVLGSWLDAHLAGASTYDADIIARAIAARPRPTYEERLAVFSNTGGPAPSQDPFKKA